MKKFKIFMLTAMCVALLPAGIYANTAKKDPTTKQAKSWSTAYNKAITNYNKQIAKIHNVAGQDIVGAETGVDNVAKDPTKVKNGVVAKQRDAYAKLLGKQAVARVKMIEKHERALAKEQAKFGDAVTGNLANGKLGLIGKHRTAQNTYNNGNDTTYGYLQTSTNSALWTAATTVTNNISSLPSTTGIAIDYKAIEPFFTDKQKTQYPVAKLIDSLN